jgi:hypothetical protein
VEKKKKIGQGGWDFRPSRKRPQRAHPQLVHWWVLIHSSRSLPVTAITPLAELLSCQQQGILARFLVLLDLNCFIRFNVNWVLARALFGPLNDAKL